MLIKMKNLLFLLGLAICIFACSEESIPAETTDDQSELYPLAIDRTWIYEYDSIVYNLQLGTTDSLHGFIREEISDSFELTDGSLNYVIDRYFRRSQDVPWSYTDTYSASIIGNKATRNEENLRFVKLLLPPSEGQEWDGNQFFDESVIVNVNGESLEVYKNWSSKILDLNKTVTINGIDYSNAVEVLLVDTENGIEKRYAKEIYAKGFGLIHKEMIIIDSQDIASGLPIIERPEKGFILEQRLIESF